MEKELTERELYFKTYGVTTRWGYWAGIVFIIFILAGFGVAIYGMVTEQYLIAVGSIVGLAVLGVVGGKWYEHQKSGGSRTLKGDPMAREVDGEILTMTVGSEIMRTVYLNYIVTVGKRAPVAYIKWKRNKIPPFEIGQQVRVLFNPSKPKFCKIVTK